MWQGKDEARNVDGASIRKPCEIRILQLPWFDAIPGTSMRVFTLSDLNRKPGELADKALVEPIVLTKHKRPQLVMLSAEQFEKLTGKPLAALHEHGPNMQGKPKFSKLSQLKSLNYEGSEADDHY
jgi:hypothetical protein